MSIMISELNIRPVELVDFTQWKSLWEEFNAYLGRAVEHSITDRTWNRFFEEKDGFFAVVAELRCEVVGFAHFFFRPNSSVAGDPCYLQDLFTRERDRSQGIGRALVEAVRSAAAQRGAESVYVETAESNRLGTELFDRISERENSCIYKLRVRNVNGNLSSSGPDGLPVAAKAASV